MAAAGDDQATRLAMAVVMQLVEDSSETVSIDLGKENFGKRLQKGLEIVAGRGKEIESVNLSGNREILGFRAK